MIIFCTEYMLDSFQCRRKENLFIINEFNTDFDVATKLACYGDY